MNSRFVREIGILPEAFKLSAEVETSPTESGIMELVVAQLVRYGEAVRREVEAGRF